MVWRRAPQPCSGGRARRTPNYLILNANRQSDSPTLYNPAGEFPGGRVHGGGCARWREGRSARRREISHFLRPWRDHPGGVSRCRALTAFPTTARPRAGDYLQAFPPSTISPLSFWQPVMEDAVNRARPPLPRPAASARQATPFPPLPHSRLDHKSARSHQTHAQHLEGAARHTPELGSSSQPEETARSGRCPR